MKRIKRFANFLNNLLIKQDRLLGGAILQEIETRQSKDKYSAPENLIPFGYKEFAQCDEDGILQEIFNRIGEKNRVFVEFGVGNGTENNTYALLFKGWKGLWIDGNPANIRHIRQHLPRTIESKTLSVEEAFITRENINQLISSHIVSEEIDLLSVDLDGNDYHIWEAINCISPRVVVIEYNAKFVPPTRYCMDYKPNHKWNSNDSFGASLQFLQEKAEDLGPGYHLVACSLSGANAFFVRSDLTDSKFEKPFSASKHYEPARYHLTHWPTGHKASLQALENSSAARNRSDPTVIR